MSDIVFVIWLAVWWRDINRLDPGSSSAATRHLAEGSGSRLSRLSGIRLEFEELLEIPVDVVCEELLKEPLWRRVGTIPARHAHPARIGDAFEPTTAAVDTW